jgi:hypothetical protein
MGANANNSDLKALFDTLIADLHKKFDSVKEQFDTINERLTNIKQCGQPDKAAATTRAQREREAVAAKLEADAKKTMVEAGRAFLKQ